MSTTLFIVCPLFFLAGFIDSIAGGGGLISIPAYFFAGLPTHNALGTNKFSAACGTTFAALTFSRNKALCWNIAAVSALASFGASFLGAKLALHLNEQILKIIILAVIPLVALIVFFKKDFGKKVAADASFSGSKKYRLACLIGIIIGFYDGLIGPGTGTFAIIAYSALMKYDLVTASGNAKVLNLASNYASMATYFFHGKIIFAIGIPAALCGIAGNWLGSSLAIKKGNRFIKTIMIVVLVLLIVKTLLDVLKIG